MMRAILTLSVAFGLSYSALAQGKSPTVGGKAPAFEASTVAGKALKFPDAYKGKIVLVDFWATWCPPCRREVPHLVETAEKLKGQPFAILSVSLDQPKNIPLEKVQSYVQDNKMTWDHVYEGVGSIASSYGVSSIPAPFLIDGDTGVVLAAGPELRGEGLTDAIKKHLDTKRSGKKP
ncbi:MAG: Thiol-disulfide oxidoreductase ResA [Phycisphaerae bacterium]|nr:Thiol-disulfide oxidoreductase ResA [Phycisphaerae bacterium]